MIDLEHLARQTAGDASLQCELLILFRTQLDDLAAQIVAVDERPRDAARAMLHRVQGAAAAIGATKLAESLGRAEAGVEKALARSEVTALVTMIEATRDETTGLIAASEARSLAKAGESR